MIKQKVWLYITLIFTFLIGNYHGYIALWTKNTEIPDYVFPYSAASLPPADQFSLKKGIRIGTEEELRQILEDYLS